MQTEYLREDRERPRPLVTRAMDIGQQVPTAFAEPPPKGCLCSGLPPDPGQPATPSHSETPGALAHLALSQLQRSDTVLCFMVVCAYGFYAAKAGSTSPWWPFTYKPAWPSHAPLRILGILPCRIDIKVEGHVHHLPHLHLIAFPFRSVELHPSSFPPSPHAIQSSISPLPTPPQTHPYHEMPTPNLTQHDAAQGSVLPPDNNHVSSVSMRARMGPWGWQWRDGLRDVVSTSPSSARITIKALMNDIEKVKHAEGCRELFIVDQECSGRTRDVQNGYRPDLF